MRIVQERVFVGYYFSNIWEAESRETIPLRRFIEHFIYVRHYTNLRMDFVDISLYYD